MYWEPDKECMDREELEQLQLERLQATLNRVYTHVPFYRKRFDSMGIAPEDVTSLADLSRLPFTTKEDLRDNYPYGLFAVPMREVVRVHASSGTTGAPTGSPVSGLFGRTISPVKPSVTFQARAIKACTNVWSLS